jgi:tetratricopeptide (TPR) repeat protein
MAIRLSVCMIVRDEAADLPRCLASLAGVGDELVVVDTGSRDATPELAAAAGARLIRSEWQHDFAAARNASVAAATGDWCVVIDADEELPPQVRAELRATIERAGAAGLMGLSVLQRNLSAPGELTAWEDLPLVRVFRRAPAVRYEGRIHEQVTPSIVRAGGRIGATDLIVLHHGYARSTAQGGTARARRNLALIEEALREDPDDAYLVYQLGATQKAIGDPAAGEALQRALAIDARAAVKALSAETEAAARMKLAQLALARGEDRTAIDEARRCLVLQPDNVTALQALVVGCVTLGRLPEAIDACQRLLTRPNLAEPVRSDLSKLLRAMSAEAARR